jgi:hypothetical protein
VSVFAGAGVPAAFAGAQLGNVVSGKTLITAFAVTMAVITLATEPMRRRW